MNRILVPTDLSTAANQAIPVAVSLARRFGAEVVLAHYLPFDLVTPGLTEAPFAIADYLDEQEKEATAALQQLCQQPEYAGVTLKPLLLRGKKGLFGGVTDQPADLIVMMSEGASGWTEWFIGSNAEHVVQTAHCPVLVLKEPMADFAPKNAICAIDVDNRLKTSRAWSFQLGDGIRQFVYVMTPTDPRAPEGIVEWMSELASARHITDYQLSIVSDRNVPDGILYFAELQKADLILLFTHQKEGLLHLLSGSVAEDVVNHASIPVLVMPIS